MVVIKDDNGNVMLTEKTHDYAYVYLRLKHERHRRQIAKINLSSGVMHMEREKSKHTMYKFDAIGFNYFVLKKTKLANVVQLVFTDTMQTFLIPIPDILEKGKSSLKWFKKQGYELQIFLTHKQLSNYEITTTR